MTGKILMRNITQLSPFANFSRIYNCILLVITIKISNILKTACSELRSVAFIYSSIVPLTHSQGPSTFAEK